MSDVPQPTPTEQIPAVAGGVSALASANAPIIFVEGAPCFGIVPGIVWVTVEALRHHPIGDKVFFDRVTTAHLKLTLGGAIALRNALNGAIAISEKPQSPAN